MDQRARVTQTALLCGCGSADLYRRDLCRRCERSERHSRERFAGLREQCLKRDGYQCRCCGEFGRLVHHRRPGINRLEYLVTVCPACHLLVHLTFRPSFAFRVKHPFRYTLWREVHRFTPEQRLLALLADDQQAFQEALFEGCELEQGRPQ